MRRLLPQLLVAIAILGGPVLAADAPPVQDWSTETVVVTARAPGPLFWRVSRGGADVWILAIVSPLPKGLPWDHTRFDQLVDGAKAVLLLPHAGAGLFEVSWFLLTKRDTLEMPGDTHLSDTLDAPLRARVAKVRADLHLDADRYEGVKPALAGLELYFDFLEKAGFRSGEPEKAIERLAGDKNVPAHPVASYDAMPVIEDIGKMTDAESRRCLISALDDIDAQQAHQTAAAKSWAAGDLAGMKQNYSESTIFSCLRQSPSFAAYWAQSVTDSTKAIDDALAGGGKTIMVTSLGALLRKGGILDRLRAEGATVTSPE